MKLNKILFSALMFSAINGAMTSCSDSFLEEDQITQYDTSYFNTQEGLDGLVTGAYEKLKFKFNYVWAIECYNMGVDEFTDANNTMPAWNHYSKDLNSAETGANQPVWDNMFALIRAANIIVTNIPQYYDQNSDTYNTRLGEGYFLRAFAYFELVKQFGGVPLVLSYSNNVETNLLFNVNKNTSDTNCIKNIILKLPLIPINQRINYLYNFRTERNSVIEKYFKKQIYSILKGFKNINYDKLLLAIQIYSYCASRTINFLIFLNDLDIFILKSNCLWGIYEQLLLANIKIGFNISDRKGFSILLNKKNI